MRDDESLRERRALGPKGGLRALERRQPAVRQHEPAIERVQIENGRPMTRRERPQVRMMRMQLDATRQPDSRCDEHDKSYGHGGQQPPTRRVCLPEHGSGPYHSAEEEWTDSRRMLEVCVGFVDARPQRLVRCRILTYRPLPVRQSRPLPRGRHS